MTYVSVSSLFQQFGDSPVQAMGGDGSEDCLYLNVWTPAKTKSDRLPVMGVWKLFRRDSFLANIDLSIFSVIP